MTSDPEAPGSPGIPPRWTSSAKTAVGASMGTASRVWFTSSHGIIDEVYYPRIDTACVRDIGLLISTGSGEFFEEKRHARSSLEWLEPGVPAFMITNQLPEGITVTKRVLTDPRRDVLLQHVAVAGGGDGLAVTVLLAPHIANRGSDNLGWVDEFKGIPMLFASGHGTTLALAVDSGWIMRSAGYVGFSDGWQDHETNGRMTWSYPAAGPGNVALAGQVAIPPSGAFTLAVGFGESPSEAGLRARASLATGFASAEASYRKGWRSWQRNTGRTVDDALETRSRTVLRVHESIAFPGASIASLSIPWGFAKGDDDMGGYHLIWPRDMVETLGGLLASGAHGDVVRGLGYLRATQEIDGHWPQNMWIDGSPYWGGVQIDETALPILAVALARSQGCPIEIEEYWPMVRRAAAFIVKNGPVTSQDRWEEDAGFSPFTVGAEIAALATAADMAEGLGEDGIATLLRDTSDVWNEAVERWMFVSDTPLAREAGVDGYYVRISPPSTSDGASPMAGWIPIKNRPPGDSSAPADSIVSPDALALVRFGLRDAHDPRITDTVKVIDHLLRSDLPQGQAWRRYNDDGYGEHEDGSPFDGTGIGRPWPLLAGERAHYEVAAGNPDGAATLIEALRRFAGPNGLIPEQVWDGPDIPDRELTIGGPTGSAMPLVWAHAEFLKLAESFRTGSVFDMPEAAKARFLPKPPEPRLAIWAPNLRIDRMRANRDLRLHLPDGAMIRWSVDGWETSTDTTTTQLLDIHFATLPTGDLSPGAEIVFAIRYHEAGWEGRNHGVEVHDPDVPSRSPGSSSVRA